MRVVCTGRVTWKVIQKKGGSKKSHVKTVFGDDGASISIHYEQISKRAVVMMEMAEPHGG